jgi:hypothetical protein
MLGAHSLSHCCENKKKISNGMGRKNFVTLTLNIICVEIWNFFFSSSLPISLKREQNYTKKKQQKLIFTEG